MTGRLKSFLAGAVLGFVLGLRHGRLRPDSILDRVAARAGRHTAQRATDELARKRANRVTVAL